MELDNPYNNEYVILKKTFDETAEGRVKMDKFVINKDIAKVMKMRYDIADGWANEYFETVEEYFHELNITINVREHLGWQDTI